MATIPSRCAANAFAAEFLMPRDAIRAWGRGAGSRAVTLEDVVVLAAEYGVSAQAARYALETAGVLGDRRRCAQLDGEIAEELHVELCARLGLEPLQDELAGAAARLPRIPRALRDSALGDLLAGEIDADGLAARLGRRADEVDAMLAELRLDQLLPRSLSCRRGRARRPRRARRRPAPASASASTSRCWPTASAASSSARNTAPDAAPMRGPHPLRLPAPSSSSRPAPSTAASASNTRVETRAGSSSPRSRRSR